MKGKEDKSLLWRWMTNIWTIITFAVILEDFRTFGGLSNLLGPVLAIYVAILAIFSAEKEFERWQWYNKSRHLGEIYVVAWTLLIFILLAGAYLNGTGYKISSEIFSTYIVVLGILAITRKSKQIFKELKGMGE
jgi:small-conductance mechanosensitive channel